MVLLLIKIGNGLLRRFCGEKYEHEHEHELEHLQSASIYYESNQKKNTTKL